MIAEIKFAVKNSKNQIIKNLKSKNKKRKEFNLSSPIIKIGREME